MERRRQVRTPVNINALLIGEKTVPKGCRVINVSQHGMMLYCDDDGRLSTFKAGDSVDIHLTVQHAGEQKKLTIPSSVRHVAENSVDVEFHHPDTILMDLIESYRISDQHKLEASLGHNPATAAKVTSITNTDFGAPRQPAQHPVHGSGHRPLYLGLLSLILAICIITGGYVYTASIDSRISTLETLTERQSDQLSEMQNRVFSASLQEGRYASLNARMGALGDAFAHLEDKLTLLIPESTNIAGSGPTARAGTLQPILIAPTGPETAAPSNPAEAAGNEKRVTASGKVGTRDSAAVESSTEPDVAGTTGTSHVTSAVVQAAAANTTQPEESAEAPAVPAKTGAASASTAPENSPAPPRAAGPWTINLLSSPDRAYVEQFAARARAKDFNVVVSEAEVKGRQYWRLQIPGFDSSAAAKAQAEPVKQALGIEDVWILKKK